MVNPIIFVLGWYAVWKLILCRFKFVRDLLTSARDTTITEINTKHNTVRKPRKH